MMNYKLGYTFFDLGDLLRDMLRNHEKIYSILLPVYGGNG